MGGGILVVTKTIVALLSAGGSRVVITVKRFIDVIVIDQNNSASLCHRHLDSIDLLHELKLRHIIGKSTAKEHIHFLLSQQPAIKQQLQSCCTSKAEAKISGLGV